MTLENENTESKLYQLALRRTSIDCRYSFLPRTNNFLKKESMEADACSKMRKRSLNSQTLWIQYLMK